MSKCKSCEFLQDCIQKYNTKPTDRSCPQLKIRICGQCIGFNECSEKIKITKLTEACEEFEPGEKIEDVLSVYFNESILPALKNGTFSDDPEVQRRAEYIARNLGSLVNKPTSEDLNRERLFSELIYEDFLIDQALENSTTLFGQIFQSQGLNIPFDTQKIESTVKTISELRLLCKVCHACGMSGYVDEIMKQAISAKYGPKAINFNVPPRKEPTQQ